MLYCLRNVFCIDFVSFFYVRICDLFKNFIMEIGFFWGFEFMRSFILVVECFFIWCLRFINWGEVFLIILEVF